MQSPQQPGQPQQVQQPQQPPAPKVFAMSPQVQALLLGDQQAEINRLTTVATKWSTGQQCRANNTNFYTGRHQSTHPLKHPNMSLVTQNYNGQHICWKSRLAETQL